MCIKPWSNVRNISTQQITTCSHHVLEGLVKRTQHFNAAYHNSVVTTCCTRLASLLQYVVACWIARAMLWKGKVKLVRALRRNNAARMWPNDYNIVQHLKMLPENFDFFKTWANSTQHVTTYCNRVPKRVQHVVPNNAAICCVEMLWLFGRGFNFELIRVNLKAGNNYAASERTSVSTQYLVLPR